jgi:two-component system cell cycle sensor histidine kinase/response regulator CckA
LQNSASTPSTGILRLIANNLTEMVLAYDMDRKLVFANPAVESLTGYSMEELEKANFICWIHPDDQARMLAFWDPLFHGKPAYEQEYRLVTKDGRVKSVVSSWTPILDDSGRQVGVLGREYDITLRKLAETAQHYSEEKLRGNDEHYRTIFENSPFPLWEEDFSEIKRYLDSLRAGGVTDVGDHLKSNRSAVEECIRRVRILDVNRAARDFYGAASKEDLLRGLQGMFDEKAFEIFGEEIATLASNNSSFHAEFAVRTLKNEERTVDMIVSIVDSARHDWSRVIVSFFDVTDRRRLEEQLLQSQKMESLGRLAGGVAHDFNNLLTVINGYTDWILGEMAPDHPIRARLTEVRRAGEQCADLTQQLLAFSRKQIVRPGPLDLNQVIRESQGVLDRVLGDDIKICTRLAPELGTIAADRSQLNQVLMNLAVNAREAMPGGGTLTIETRNIERSTEVLLEISDTGQGMDESTRLHLFEPFYTTKKGSKNTGLGLATVFGIVSRAGGRIEVRSEPSQGAVFRIYMPRIERPAETETKHLRVRRPSRRKGTVLVVEDRDEVRAITCRMLEQLGYQPLAASGGADALLMAARHTTPIPLLLADVVMPGMNGRELAAQLHQVYPDMRVIFMSGYTDRILTHTGTLESWMSYLQKPFTLAQLEEVLQQAETV